jgi:hypothetical protein
VFEGENLIESGLPANEQNVDLLPIDYVSSWSVVENHLLWLYWLAKFEHIVEVPGKSLLRVGNVVGKEQVRYFIGRQKVDTFGGARNFLMRNYESAINVDDKGQRTR